MTGGVEISLRDIYDSQQASRTEVAQLGAKFDQLNATVNLQLAAGAQRMDEQARKHDQLEERVRAGEVSPKVSPEDFGKLEERTEKLEGLAGRVIGIGLVMMFLGAIIAAAVGALITHALGK